MLGVGVGIAEDEEVMGTEALEEGNTAIEAAGDEDWAHWTRQHTAV